ncbi:MAG: hypothetical protein HY399_06500, partial [Elusimicrobia bacterium]|nr:hypothetical protein [Elusimicrobiota bacterium]
MLKRILCFLFLSLLVWVPLQRAYGQQPTPSEVKSQDKTQTKTLKKKRVKPVSSAPTPAPAAAPAPAPTSIPAPAAPSNASVAPAIAPQPTPAPVPAPVSAPSASVSEPVSPKKELEVKSELGPSAPTVESESKRTVTPYFNMALSEATFIPTRGDIFTGGQLNAHLGLLWNVRQDHSLFGLYNFKYDGPSFQPQDQRAFQDRSLS